MPTPPWQLLKWIFLCTIAISEVPVNTYALSLDSFPRDFLHSCCFHIWGSCNHAYLRVHGMLNFIQFSNKCFLVWGSYNHTYFCVHMMLPFIIYFIHVHHMMNILPTLQDTSKCMRAMHVDLFGGRWFCMLVVSIFFKCFYILVEFDLC